MFFFLNMYIIAIVIVWQSVNPFESNHLQRIDKIYTVDIALKIEIVEKYDIEKKRSAKTWQNIYTYKHKAIN